MLTFVLMSMLVPALFLPSSLDPGIADLSTELTPPPYTMMLTAAVMPTIQVVIPGNLVSPVTASSLPQSAASTALGKSEIIKYTKLKVLPDLDSPELMAADKNSATRVLAVAIYLKVEHLFLMTHHRVWT